MVENSQLGGAIREVRNGGGRQEHLLRSDDDTATNDSLEWTDEEEKVELYRQQLLREEQERQQRQTQNAQPQNGLP